MAKKTVAVKCTSAFMAGGKMVHPGEVVQEVPYSEAVNLQVRGKGKIMEVPVDGDDPENELPELSEMTVEELKGVAENYGLEGYSSMKKADLIAAIEAHEASNSEDG